MRAIRAYAVAHLVVAQHPPLRDQRWAAEDRGHDWQLRGAKVRAELERNRIGSCGLLSQ
jgi:hypothetical protein